MHYLLLLIALTICSCEVNEKVAKYFKRPIFEECIANGDGTMFCNGKLELSENAACIRPLDAFEMKSYYNDKEFRLYKCLKNPRGCR